MRVILFQDIDKLGKKYDIKEVADGYSKNFLIPKGLARLASEKNLKWIETQKGIMMKKKARELKKIQKLVSDINGQKITILVKVGSQDQLFESITAQRILEELKKTGFELKKGQIDLEKPIRELGEFSVKIKFEDNLEGEIKVIIAEKNKVVIKNLTTIA